MNQTVKSQTVPYQIEADPPPVPKRLPPPPRPKADYPFELIGVGQAMRIPRSISTVTKKICEFKKTPLGAARKFRLRAVNPRLTRIWRIK